MIVVYRAFLGERIYDRLEDTRVAPGRPSPGAGPRIHGRLVRGGENVTTATGTDAWCAVVTKEGILTSDMPEFSPEEEARHEELWTMFEGLREDVRKVQAGEYVPPARLLMLLKNLSGLDLGEWAGVWEYRVTGMGDTWSHTIKEDMRKAYLEQKSDLNEVTDQLKDAFRNVQSLLHKAESMVTELSPIPEPQVDVEGAMVRFKKVPKT